LKTEKDGSQACRIVKKKRQSCAGGTKLPQEETRCYGDSVPRRRRENSRKVTGGSIASLGGPSMAGKKQNRERRDV